MIESLENTQIKKIGKLKQKKYRDRFGSFIVEGVRNCEEVLRSNWFIEKVFFSEVLLKNERGRALLEELKLGEREIFQLKDEVLSKVTLLESSPGILLQVQKKNHNRQEWTDFNKILLVDKVQDPGNLGTIIRTALAGGMEGIVFLTGTVDVFNDKVIRSSMGAVFKLPFWQEVSEKEAISYLRDSEFRILTTDLQGKDLYTCQDIFVAKKIALVVGNEAQGVSEFWRQQADHLLKIPMVSGSESLNVAVAAGVIIYECYRQRL